MHTSPTQCLLSGLKIREHLPSEFLPTALNFNCGGGGGVGGKSSMFLCLLSLSQALLLTVSSLYQEVSSWRFLQEDALSSRSQIREGYSDTSSKDIVHLPPQTLSHCYCFHSLLFYHWLDLLSYSYTWLLSVPPLDPEPRNSSHQPVLFICITVTILFYFFLIFILFLNFT